MAAVMSSSRALCCLPSVKKQKHDLNFFFVQCIINKLLDSVFVISRIIKVSVRVISRSRRLRLITLTSTLIILDITKTSSNNCLEVVSDNGPQFVSEEYQTFLKMNRIKLPLYPYFLFAAIYHLIVPDFLCPTS